MLTNSLVFLVFAWRYGLLVSTLLALVFCYLPCVVHAPAISVFSTWWWRSILPILSVARPLRFVLCPSRIYPIIVAETCDGLLPIFSFVWQKEAKALHYTAVLTWPKIRTILLWLIFSRYWRIKLKIVYFPHPTLVWCPHSEGICQNCWMILIPQNYNFLATVWNKKIKQSWQTSVLAMHLPLARLVSVSVIFCLLPSSSIVILVFYLFSTDISEQHTAWELWVWLWILFTGLTLPLRVTPTNNPITLI